MTDATNQQLLSFVQRWERLQEEKEAIAQDQKEVMAEAKAQGFDVPALKRLIALRKLTREERQEREALDETYQAAIGMLAGTPLGDASRPASKPEEGDGWGEKDKAPIRKGVSAEAYDPETGELRPQVRSIEEVPSLSGVVVDALDPDTPKSYGAVTAKMETRTVSGAVDSLRQMLA